MVTFLVQSTVIDDLKVEMVCGLVGTDEFLPFEKLAEAKLWREQRFGHVKKTLTAIPVSPCPASNRECLLSQFFDEVMMQTINMAGRCEKYMGMGPLRGLLKDLTVDVLWYELEADGMPDAETVSAWIDRDPECMLITCGGAGATEKMITQLKVKAIPHICTIGVFCKDEPPSKTASILTFITPMPLLKPCREEVATDLPFLPNIIAAVYALLDDVADGQFQHIVYRPRKDTTSDSVVRFLTNFVIHCVGWEVSCVRSERGSEELLLLSHMQVRNKVQERVDRVLPAYIDFEFKNETLMFARDPNRPARPRRESTETSEYRKAFPHAKKVALLDNPSGADAGSNSRPRDAQEESVQPDAKKKKTDVMGDIQPPEIQATEKAVEPDATCDDAVHCSQERDDNDGSSANDAEVNMDTKSADQDTQE
jgi:hypothetical protein